MKKFSLASFALLGLVSLSGCGGDDDGNKNSSSNGSGLSGDNFIETVRSVVAQSPDNTEPADIDNVTATADDGEPADI